MRYSLVNDRNTYESVPDFFARNPDVASKAALYVWRNSQANLTEDEFSGSRKKCWRANNS